MQFKRNWRHIFENPFGWRVFVGVVIGVGLAASGYGQIPGPDPNVLEFSDGPAGTPCDSARGLPCDRTPPHLVGLPDPQRWSVTGRGTTRAFYRRATAKERKANNWTVGTYLVASRDAAGLTKGARKARLVIPLADYAVHEVNFELHQRVEGLEFFERIGVPDSPNGEVISRTLRPILFQYFNEGFDPRRPGPVKGSWAKVVASDDGGIYASGIARGLEFEVDGPGGGWNLEPVPAPFGFVPNQSGLVTVKLLTLGTFGGTQFNSCQGAAAPEACEWICAEMIGVPCDNNTNIGPGSGSAHHCVDEIDNDFDGTTDFSDQDCTAQEGWGDAQHPGFPRRHWESGNSFALFGEGRFCTNFATAEFSPTGVKTSGNWINRLTAMGWKTESLLNQAIGFQAVTGREKQFRYRAGGCWIFPTLEAATNCAENGGQCLSGYPYANAENVGSGYYNNVWDDVHHATFHGLNDALHLAQTVFWGGSNNETSYVLSCAEEAGCCGAAPIGFDDNQHQWGASVVQYEEPGGGCNIAGAGVTGAHEMGHSSGIINHVNIVSFMHSPSNDSPSLPAADKATLVGCVESANCPRPSGFRYDP